MGNINLGKRRHLITIQSVTVTPSGFGVPTEVWSNVSTVWASKNVPSQVRALLNGVDTLEGTVVWNIGYMDSPLDGNKNTTLNKTNRIVDDFGDIYEITSIVPNEKIELQIITTIHK